MRCPLYRAANSSSLTKVFTASERRVEFGQSCRRDIESGVNFSCKLSNTAEKILVKCLRKLLHNKGGN